MATTLPWAISNANRGVTFVYTRFWATLNSGSFDLIEHFHRMLVTAPAADLGRFTAIRFRSARLRQNWEFARHTFRAATNSVNFWPTFIDFRGLKALDGKLDHN